MSVALELNGLCKHFSGIEILKGVTTSIPRGQVTALIGSNGAGKSTLLNIVSGLIRPNAGTIFLHGVDITATSAHQRARAGLLRTFQHPRSFRSLTVVESVMLAARLPEEETLVGNLLRTFKSRDSDAAEGIARRVLALCRLEGRAEIRASELSYGEQKLLMLAQTLAADGKLMCFDELCAGLEEGVVDHIAHQFRELADEGQTILFIEHNLRLVRQLADRVVFLHMGKVFREGSTDHVLRDPDVVQLYLGK
ncbi:ATP-binding cassette domain-containing protein [Bradyrhizobium sp. CSA207]|uniref:ABC transporter ATP-binding protein n=1 Tax=Bradyrhizobium sp. CSA207 TaxID=2698826 RepID=UPI0023AF9025|nr:ATP-binding cassette domain-containing protein [Bradyrhizobium sp. CSA207]MDE5444329.1 ATP-binding cassette domain-containing protein [Bradyrhizobium sp. CSA207]